MLLFTLTGTFASAATLSTTIRLATYAVTCAALPVLRRDGRREQAPFAVPGGDLVAAVALLLIAWLFSSSAWPDAARRWSPRRSACFCTRSSRGGDATPRRTLESIEHC